MSNIHNHRPAKWQPSSPSVPTTCMQADIGKRVEEKISKDQRRYFLMEQVGGWYGSCQAASTCGLTGTAQRVGGRRQWHLPGSFPERGPGVPCCLLLELPRSHSIDASKRL